MENQEQITKIQHFLPQFYLREFSESEKGIYRHDIEFPNKETVWTSIKKECSEPFLYEKKTETGELLEPNKLEKMFAQFETDFSNTIKAIKRKAFNKANYNTASFLTKEEKQNLLVFISLQLLRYPEMLKYGQDIAKEVHNNEIDNLQARNFAIEMYYNSLFRLKNNQEGPNITFSVLKWFDNMAFKIGVSERDVVITSDLPMCFYNKKGLYPFEGTPDQVTVPLTSRLVLYLSPMESEDRGKRNILFPLTDEDIQEEHTAMFMMARHWIYSYSPLNEEDILQLVDDRLFKDDRRKDELL